MYLIKLNNGSNFCVLRFNFINKIVIKKTANKINAEYTMVCWKNKIKISMFEKFTVLGELKSKTWTNILISSYWKVTISS